MPRPAPGQWEDVAFAEFCVEPGWYQRMLRAGPWKLVHYHGHRPQLFNLEDDPGEGEDLADDPRHAARRADLTARVLEGWDADAIAGEIERAHARWLVLRDWARATHPQERYRWAITSEMHYLEPPLPEGAGG